MLIFLRYIDPIKYLKKAIESPSDTKISKPSLSIALCDTFIGLQKYLYDT